MLVDGTRLDPLGSLWPLIRHGRGASREQLHEFQARRLRRLVAHAYDRVPFYRQHLDRHGLRPGDIRTPGDLRALPVIGKADLRDRPVAEIVARGVDPRRLITRTTSGSSGEPFTIRRTWLEERLLGTFASRR